MLVVGVRRSKPSPDLLVCSIRSAILGGAVPDELTDGCLSVLLPPASGA